MLTAQAAQTWPSRQKDVARWDCFCARLARLPRRLGRAWAGRFAPDKRQLVLVVGGVSHNYAYQNVSPRPRAL